MLVSGGVRLFPARASDSVANARRGGHDHAMTTADPAHPPTLWANRNYVALFAAQVVSLAGSGMTSIGLALFAYQLTGGASATAIIGNALMLRILAFLVFSQPAGVLADRLDRKKILVAADLV